MVCLRVSNQYAVDTLCKQLRMDGWKYPVSRGAAKGSARTCQIPEFEVPVGNVPPGTYSIRINDRNATRMPAELLIQHSVFHANGHPRKCPGTRFDRLLAKGPGIAATQSASSFIFHRLWLHSQFSGCSRMMLSRRLLYAWVISPSAAAAGSGQISMYSTS